MTDKTTQDRLRDLLVGQEIDRADGNMLYLKNGVSLEMYMSDNDCCAVAHGNWLPCSDDLHAGITDVTFEESNVEYESEYEEPYAECIITILHNGGMLAVGEGYAGTGNSGYYFSVLSLKARMGNDEIDNFELIEA